MSDTNSYILTMRYARISGILYLAIIVLGIYSEVFIRSNLIVSGDAIATATQIINSKAMFLISFAADSLMLVCDVAISVLLYILFKSVNKTIALTSMVFRLTQAAILGLNLLHYFAALLLINSDGYGTIITTDQIYYLVLFFLELHSYGYDLGLIFFGVSNLFLGYLIVKSNYFPNIIGYGLTVAAIVYLTGSYIRFLLPEYLQIFDPLYIIPFLAELSFCLWLLVKGIKS